MISHFRKETQNAISGGDSMTSSIQDGVLDKYLVDVRPTGTTVGHESNGLFKKSAACFTSKAQDYGTPKCLYEELNKEFHFVLDPATSADNPLQTKYWYTETDNGLVSSWNKGGNVYVNPPYHSRRSIDKWVKKAHDESLEHKITVVMLLPVRSDTRWFHNYIWNRYKFYDNVEVRFLKGRLKFQTKDQIQNSAPFPSLLAIFRPPPLEAKQEQEKNKGDTQ
jgi:phage N-6-adenine-methyltransferase